MSKNKAQQTAQVVAESDELRYLRGFRDLVAEGIGYYLAGRAVQSEASEKTGTERKAVNVIRKHVSSHVSEYIQNADLKGYNDKMEELKTARAKLAEAMKPWNQKKAPLAKGWKYMLNIGIPDGLKAVGGSVAPRFTLSPFVAGELSKKNKKEAA